MFQVFSKACFLPLHIFYPHPLLDFLCLKEKIIVEGRKFKIKRFQSFVRVAERVHSKETQMGWVVSIFSSLLCYP